MESYPDKVLKDLDGRTATKAPWQRNSTNKPFKKRPYPVKTVEGLDEDEEDDDDDAYALDDYYEDDDYGDEEDDEDDEDEDQVAYVDEE